jgi:5-methylcytosine-specific restriction endonuclease McrA
MAKRSIVDLRPLPESLVCRKCNIDQPLGSFDRSKLYWHGRRLVCKSCRKAERMTQEAKERRKEYDRTHADRIDELRRGHYALRGDEYRQRARDRYWSDPQKYRDAAMNWHLENKERARANHKAWAKANATERKAYLVKWRSENAALIREYSKTYYINHRDQCLAYHARRREYYNALARQYSKRNIRKMIVRGHLRRLIIRSSANPLTIAQWDAICEHYGNICLCCGESKKLTIDHIIPLSRNGTHTADNIQPLCHSCNARKGNRHMTDYRPFPPPV